MDTPPFDTGNARVRQFADVALARRVGVLVETLVLLNEQWLNENGTPPLYQSGVRYIERDRLENFKDIGHVLSDGGGDCEDLAAWRIAELRFLGDSGAMAIIQFDNSNTDTLYHVTVLRGDGVVEDPSRLLGMR